MKRDSFILRLSYIFEIPFLAFMLLLVFLSAWKSVYFPLEQEALIPFYGKDHPVVLVAYFVLVVFGLRLFIRRTSKWQDIRAMKIIAVLATGIICSFFLLTLKSQPYMDCLAVDGYASAFLAGDYSGLGGAEPGYLHIYPFQIGYIAFVQLIYRIAGSGNYFAVQVMHIFIAMWFTATGMELCDVLFQDRDSRKIYMVLSCFMLPFFVFTTFVYGDVPGPAFAAAAFLQVLRFISDRKWLRLLPAAVCIAIAVLLKSNTQIYLVAMVIILLLEAFRQKKLAFAGFALALVVTVFVSGGAVNAYYAGKAGIASMPAGAPKTAWIAMGLQNDGYGEYGWYNGYNVNTFTETGYDTDATDAMARESIKTSINRILSDPFNGAYFFYAKFASSWNDPMYNSSIQIEWASRHVENLSPLARSMIYGRGRTILYWIMNVVHFVVYLGVVAALIDGIRKKRLVIAYYVLPVFGGLFFHLIWETNCRYIMPYYAFLFPLAAGGLNGIITMLPPRQSNRR